MNRNRAIVLAALVLTCGAFVFAGLQNTSPSINTVNPLRVVKPWRKLVSKTAADGAALTDPQAWGSWATAAIEACGGGRTYLNFNGDPEVEVMVLFSTSGATATYQLFASDAILRAEVPDSATSGLVYPSADNATAINVSYPLAADDGATTFIDTATAGKWKGAASGCVLYPDQSTNGTTYYVGAMHRFDSRGMYGLTPYLVDVTTSTTVIFAARTAQ